jgi:hypothetical protein
MVVVQLVLGAFLALGLGIVAYGGLQVLVALQIHRSERDAVRDATAGSQVDMEGAARVHEETLEAPVSGRDCLGYEYEVEEYSSSGEGSGWDTVDSGGTTVPFLLETDTGTVLVSDADPSLAINDGKQQVTLDSHEEVPEPIRRFVQRNQEVDPVGGHTIDLKLTEIHTGKRRRYTEYPLLPGETTYVTGVGNSPATASIHVPREASALVRGPEREPSGILGQVKRRLWPLSFLVADSPMNESRNDYLRKGIGLVLFGLFLTGIPLVLILQASGPATF